MDDSAPQELIGRLTKAPYAEWIGRTPPAMVATVAVAG
jgi:hypothetical protein